jgi:hypothetical protein
MGRAGNSLIKGIGIEEIIDALDRFHAQSWVVVHFSIALKNRLEGVLLTWRRLAQFFDTIFQPTELTCSKR